jgi:hypothetical protein
MNNSTKKESVNIKRQIELDLARGLAVLFMIMVHILEIFSDQSVAESWYGEIVFFLGGPPAAPVFMFLLGVGIVFSSKSNAQTLLKRGLWIFILGYLLNFLRGSLPNLIGFLLLGDQELLIASLYELITIDILQFAGLTLIFFAVIKKYNLNFVYVLFVGVLISALNFVLQPIKVDHILLAAISGLIWGSSQISFFPFSTWLIYPIAGYLFGMQMIKYRDKKLFYKRLFISSFLILIFSSFIIVGVFGIDIGLEDDYAYYHHHIIGGLIYLSFVVCWLSILFFTSKLFAGLIGTTINRWSKNVTAIYFIHWVIIGFLTLLLGINSYSIIQSLLITLGVLIVSDMLSIIYRKKLQLKHI